MEKLPYLITDDIEFSHIIRISLEISETNILYALMATRELANSPILVDPFYRLDDGVTVSPNWKGIPLPSKEVYRNDIQDPKNVVWQKDTIGGQGNYVA